MKSDVNQLVDRLFDECKSAGVKKIRLRGARSYVGLREKLLLKVTNHQIKYRKFSAKFTNKVTLQPVRAKDVMSQLQIDLVNMKSRCHPKF